MFPAVVFLRGARKAYRYHNASPVGQGGGFRWFLSAACRTRTAADPATIVATTPMSEDHSNASATTPSMGDFDDILALIGQLPDGDDAAGGAAAGVAAGVVAGRSLGELDAIAHWVATWQGRYPPQLGHGRIAVFAGSHGVAAGGTAALVAEIVAGNGAVNRLAKMHDADLQIYEMALDQPTADFTLVPAMSEAECVTAIAYGMTAVEPGIQLLALGTLGVGGRIAAAALCHLLFGGEVADWVPKNAPTEIIKAGVARHQATAETPLAALACLGGQELAAIVGAVIAARAVRVPVLLDGFVALAAAAVLQRIAPGMLDHCRIADRTEDAALDKLAGIIGQRPLLALGIDDPAAGGAVALGLVRQAVACHDTGSGGGSD